VEVMRSKEQILFNEPSPLLRAIYTEEGYETTSRVDKQNLAISSTQCCPPRYEIWQHHVESVPFITHVFFQIFSAPAILPVIYHISCSNYWQQESTG
jgi:hypothetical protein